MLNSKAYPRLSILVISDNEIDLCIKITQDPSVRDIILHFFLVKRCSVDVMPQRHIFQAHILGQFFSFYPRKTSQYPATLKQICFSLWFKDIFGRFQKVVKFLLLDIGKLSPSPSLN
ncbi:hypothetical protein NPIL_319721 [Nephila pilipes]|uniref:Uncharacterized protein n=1 Tax=Nephila pilipes TaxID=299642 RepID=A0A8X6I8Q4_NEPPI|nr:hypothetical protein NPIL_319721 [Nephila pilipes]